MSCAICTNLLNEEPDNLFSGSADPGPSPRKQRKCSTRSGSGGGEPSTSRGGGSRGSEENTGLCVTKCGHPYHNACIGRWLEVETGKKTKKCPLCQKNVVKKELRPLYLDGVSGGEGMGRKLKGEMEEKSKQLMESKHGQREMSQRIDELFEENENLKRKNRELQEVTKTSDHFWQVLEDRIKELEGENRSLEKRIGELGINVEPGVKSNGDLELTNRELNERNQLLNIFLEAEQKKCIEVEEKNKKLKGKLARTMEISGTLYKELQEFGREIDGGDGGVADGSSGGDGCEDRKGD